MITRRERQTLVRLGFAEFLGSAALVCAVIGSGIAAQRLSSDDGLRLLENALATGAALAVLIMVLQPVSGAHFNPVVTLVDRLLGDTSTRAVAVYLPAQLLGGVLGAVLANMMFGLPAVTISTQHRDGGGLWLSEALATFGLLLVIFGLARSGSRGMIPLAVGGYITAAYWWSSSTSFANPMIDIARTLSDTFAGIAPASVPFFVVAQAIGALAAVAVVVLLYPATNVNAEES